MRQVVAIDVFLPDKSKTKSIENEQPTGRRQRNLLMSASFREVLRPNEADAWRRWPSPRERADGAGGAGTDERAQAHREPRDPIPPLLAPAPRRWWCCLAGDGDGNHQLVVVVLLPPPGDDSGGSSSGYGAGCRGASGRRLRRTIAESHDKDRRGGSFSFAWPSSACRPPTPKIAARKDRRPRATFRRVTS
jgi:hypothetical protein